MKVLKVRNGAKLPVKADGDMCYDIFACIPPEAEMWVFHGEVAKVPTGIIWDMSPYHGSIRCRSSLASKGLDVLGGQIDSSYRGEIFVMLTNHNTTGSAYRIKNGDKIAQVKLEHDITVEIQEVEDIRDLSFSHRCASGFGRTGN